MLTLGYVLRVRGTLLACKSYNQSCQKMQKVCSILENLHK